MMQSFTITNPAQPSDTPHSDSPLAVSTKSSALQPAPASAAATSTEMVLYRPPAPFAPPAPAPAAAPSEASGPSRKRNFEAVEVKVDKATSANEEVEELGCPPPTSESCCLRYSFTECGSRAHQSPPHRLRR
jgi:hypothetical protein